jgi:hypothetical protein
VRFIKLIVAVKWALNNKTNQGTAEEITGNQIIKKCWVSNNSLSYSTKL